jgi:hypothetical protein
MQVPFDEDHVSWRGADWRSLGSNVFITTSQGRFAMQKTRSKFTTFTAIALGLSIAIFFLLVAARGVDDHSMLRSGPEDHVITLAQAVKLIENFRNAPTAPTIKGGYFSRSIFDTILSQAGCAGVRYYYAKKDDGTATIVLVGVDAAGNDITQGVLGNESLPCPPYCGAPNDLNR